MNPVARAVKSAAWLLADNWTGVALSLVSFTLLARWIGPTDFGTMALAGLVFSAVGIFVGGALTESLEQRPSVEPGHLDAMFWLNAGLCAAAAGLIAACAGPIGRLFGSGTLADILPVLALAAFISSLGAVPRALLERDLDQPRLVALGMFISVPSTLAAVVMAWLGCGVWSLVASGCLVAVLGTAGVFRLTGWRPGLAARPRHFRELARFNRDTIAMNLLGYLDDALPRVLLAFAAGERAVGIFDLAMKLTGQISGLVIGPLNGIAMNVVARMQNDPRAVGDLLERVFRLTTALMYPAMLGMFAIAPLALPLLFGEAWADAVPPAQAALLIGIRSASGNFNFAILRGFGDTASPLRILAAGLVLQTLLSPLIFLHGATGAAIAVAIRLFLTWPLSARCVERVSGFPARRQFTIGWQALVAAGIRALAVMAALAGLPDGVPALPALAGAVALGMLAYAGLLVAFRQAGMIRSSLNWFKTQMSLAGT